MQGVHGEWHGVDKMQGLIGSGMVWVVRDRCRGFMGSGMVLIDAGGGGGGWHGVGSKG